MGPLGDNLLLNHLSYTILLIVINYCILTTIHSIVNLKKHLPHQNFFGLVSSAEMRAPKRPKCPLLMNIRIYYFGALVSVLRPLSIFFTFPN